VSNKELNRKLALDTFAFVKLVMPRSCTDHVSHKLIRPYNVTYVSHKNDTRTLVHVVVKYAFTGTLRRKFAIKLSLQMPPHVKGVATPYLMKYSFSFLHELSFFTQQYKKQN